MGSGEYDHHEYGSYAGDMGSAEYGSNAGDLDWATWTLALASAVLPRKLTSCRALAKKIMLIVPLELAR